MNIGWKGITSIAAGVGAVLGVVIAAPKAIDVLDDAGFPVTATRAYVRTAIAHDRAANIVIRDALISLTVTRRNSLARDRDAVRERISTATDPDVRRAWQDSFDRYNTDIADTDETLATLRKLRQH